MVGANSSDIPQISGPRVGPQSGEAPEKLVVLVHGYGADGKDLIGLSGPWTQELPTAAFVAPDGPNPCGMSPFGREWFPMSNRGAAERREGVRQAAPILDAFIDQELEHYGLTDEQLALVGFSQGTMMSLHVGLRRPRPMAAIVGYSGMLTGTGYLEDEVTVKPPVLLVHGSHDDVIAVSSLDHASEALRGIGVDVHSHVSEGVGHGVAPDGVKLGMSFLKNAFAGTLRDG